MSTDKFIITDDEGFDWEYDDACHVLYLKGDDLFGSLQRVHSFGEAVGWLMDNEFLTEAAQ